MHMLCLYAAKALLYVCCKLLPFVAMKSQGRLTHVGHFIATNTILQQSVTR